MDDDTREEYSNKINSMMRDQLSLTLQSKIRASRIGRAARPSRRTVAKVEQRNAKAWERAEQREQKREEAEAKAAAASASASANTGHGEVEAKKEGGGEAEAEADQPAAAARTEDAVQVTQRRNVLLKRVRKYIDVHRHWLWAHAKTAYAAMHPRPQQFAVQARFVLLDDDIIRKAYLSLLLLIHRGHAWCIATDNLDGLPGMLRETNNLLVLPHNECIGTLPQDPHFSRKFAKGKLAHRVKNLAIDRVPFVRLPFWHLQWLPSALVQDGVQTQADFERAFPDNAQRADLRRATIQAQLKLLRDVEEWRADVEATTQRESKVKQVVAQGKRAADALLADVPTS